MMRKIHVLVTSVLAVMLLICCMLPLEARAATSGNWGNTITWTYDEETEVMTVSGTGQIPDDYFMNNCKRIMATREKTASALASLGFEVIPSQANFIFAKHKTMDGEDIYLALKERGVLVRHFTSPRIADFNRITVGSEDEMESFISILSDIVASS